jgi:hypothetical protein
MVSTDMGAQATPVRKNACEKLPGRSPVDRAPNADIPSKSGEGSPPVGKNSN